MSANLAERPQTQMESVRLPGVEWCELTTIGLKILKPNFSYEEWEAALPPLEIIDKGSQFDVGDWLVRGEKRHGEKCTQAIDASKKTGIKVKTLLEYRRVSEKVPYSIRMESLDWSHHQIVAGLKTRDERQKWLQFAAEHDLKPPQLTRAIKDADKPESKTTTNGNYLDPHYKQFLLDYIATQYSFLNRCNYEPFKKEIEKTIKAANFQRARTENSDYELVQNQVDEGACTVEEVAEEVYLSTAEIKPFLIQMVGCEPPSKDGDPRHAGTDYEWRPIGCNTEMAKGPRSYGVFRKDAPSGDAFTAYRNRSFGPEDFES